MGRRNQKLEVPAVDIAGIDLAKQLERVSGRCIECPKCRDECAFLRRYGSPKAIAEAAGRDDAAYLKMAYECSLCGLCGAVCPVDLKPETLFLAMRQAAVSQGIATLRPHASILSYEKRGTSRRYTLYSLPDCCNTVFFPGCALTGTRPDTVLSLYEHLRSIDPDMGIVLDCCGKPSHDLGISNRFSALFVEMKTWLLQNGVRRVIVACPNCYQVFSAYGASLAAQTIYEFLVEKGLPETGVISGDTPVSVHDSCVLRYNEAIQTCVRLLVRQKGVSFVEMPHSGTTALCCGEGGSVGYVDTALADAWKIRRKTELAGSRLITYCAGCSGALKKVAPVSHILDLVVDPEATLTGRRRVARPPFTYLNRLRVKKTLRKRYPDPVTRERTFTVAAPATGRDKKLRLLLLAAVVAAIAVLHAVGTGHLPDPESLKQWVAAFGFWAPLIYMLFYSVAPALLLPGLPITIAGGLLFGPVWGVVYAITGATAGACIAFLIARYAARERVMEMLRHPGWRRLDDGVALHGWKIVAFTRLVPLFPFNLLNYAFGITKIRFFDYAIVSFFCMLPACIAIIVFSSSLPALIGGHVSFAFVAGLVLVAVVSIIPMLFR